MEKYDVIVVGAGNGGLSTADFACQRGLKTIILKNIIYLEELSPASAGDVLNLNHPFTKCVKLVLRKNRALPASFSKT